MKLKLFFCLLSFMFFLNATSCPAQSATYNLDIVKSKLYWKGTNKVGTAHVGLILFKAGMLITSDTGAPTGGNFVIDMNSMRSTDHPLPQDNKKVNDELKSDMFFSVPSYPTSTINITGIIPADTTNLYTVTGNLTIKNITQKVSFKALIKHTGNRLKATAAFSIDRIKWGIHERPNPNVMWSLQNALMSDDIPIRLDLEFVVR